MIQKKIFHNGITVLYERRSTDSVAIVVSVRVGSDYERKHERGITHFVEHMVFEGTTKRSAQELANAIERTGGELNAVTAQDRTIFYAVVPRRHFHTALSVLSDLLLHPVFDPKAIEKEKPVVVDEMSMLVDDEFSFNWTRLLAKMFVKHPARLSVYGTVPSVRSLTRKQVLDFFHKYHVGRNVTISIVGEVKRPFPEVHKFFKAMREGTASRYRLLREVPRRTRRQFTFVRDVRRTYVTLGFPAPLIADKDYYTLEVVRALLSKGQSSRLFNEVRTKRGLAYTIDAIYQATSHFGVFGVFFSCDAPKVATILSLVEQQLHLPQLRESEVEEAKDYLMGNFTLQTEETRERADLNIIWSSLGLEPHEYLRGVQRVTVADVHRAVRKYFKKNATVIITRP